jgi:hypothetical protein
MKLATFIRFVKRGSLPGVARGMRLFTPFYRVAWPAGGAGR